MDENTCVTTAATRDFERNSKPSLFLFRQSIMEETCEGHVSKNVHEGKTGLENAVDPPAVFLMGGFKNLMGLRE